MTLLTKLVYYLKSRYANDNSAVREGIRVGRRERKREGERGGGREGS